MPGLWARIRVLLVPSLLLFFFCWDSTHRTVGYIGLTSYPWSSKKKLLGRVWFYSSLFWLALITCGWEKHMGNRGRQCPEHASLPLHWNQWKKWFSKLNIGDASLAENAAPTAGQVFFWEIPSPMSKSEPAFWRKVIKSAPVGMPALHQRSRRFYFRIGGLLFSCTMNEVWLSVLLSQISVSVLG